ncbi:MAG TPA: response regulator [Gemmatimonadales bacterium]|nr:response regulator [Gemmatimonadales bacterium]
MLVVDDDAALRRMVRRWLTHAGYAVIEAEDGASALQILLDPTERVDLVLTDMEMPALNGRELAALLRTANVRTPLVLMSGNAQRANEPPVQPGEPAPALLPKPFTPAQLLDALRQAAGPD